MSLSAPDFEAAADSSTTLTGRSTTAVRPLRVLYSHYLIDDRHVAAEMVERVAVALRALRHEVQIHRSWGPPPPATEPPKADNAARRRRNPLRKMLWFAKMLAHNPAMQRRDLQAVRDYRPDVILARQEAYCFSMPRVAQRLGVPMVTYADAPVAYESRLFARQTERWHPPGLVETIERLTLKRSRAAITISHLAAKRLQAYGTGTPVHVVSNGYDPSGYETISNAERLNRRRALGLTAPRVIAFTATFRPFHGTELLGKLIRATANREDTQWLLVGDGPERARLQQTVAEGNGKALFLGQRPLLEIGGLLALADIAVLPHPVFDGDFYFCPSKVIQYMAAGCAVVAAALGDVPILLDHGRVGVLVDSPDPNTWHAALSRLLDDPHQTAALGQTGRLWASNQYTWSHAARKIEQTLYNAIDGP